MACTKTWVIADRRLSKQAFKFLAKSDVATGQRVSTIVWRIMCKAGDANIRFPQFYINSSLLLPSANVEGKSVSSHKSEPHLSPVIFSKMAYSAFVLRIVAFCLIVILCSKPSNSLNEIQLKINKTAFNYFVRKMAIFPTFLNASFPMVSQRCEASLFSLITNPEKVISCEYIILCWYYHYCFPQRLNVSNILMTI